MSQEKKASVTVLLSAGRLPADVMGSPYFSGKVWIKGLSLKCAKSEDGCHSRNCT